MRVFGLFANSAKIAIDAFAASAKSRRVMTTNRGQWFEVTANNFVLFGGVRYLARERFFAQPESNAVRMWVQAGRVKQITHVK